MSLLHRAHSSGLIVLFFYRASSRRRTAHGFSRGELEPAKNSCPPPLKRWATHVLLAFVLGIVAIGCDGTQTTWFGKEDRSADQAEEASLDKDPRDDSAGVRDTIASVAWVEGLRRMAVGGYGLVVGLGKNGTTQCPRPIREYMLQDMRRRYRLGSENEELAHLSPEQMLDSEETAVVVVYGEIPAAAQKGAKFDLKVRALAGTDVRSLEGGWLMPSTLKLWVGDRPVDGRVLGEGAGQVFINPFGLKEDAATKANPREGRIIGGGTTNKARRLRMVLMNPSAAIASRVMYLVNRQFGVDPVKTADADGPHAVTLKIPEAWHGREPHFLELLTHLYVPASPSFEDTRIRELSEEAVQPEAALADISLAWEGLGKTVLPSIRKLYTHQTPAVSYFAARAGMRLNDGLAMDVLARHANDANGEFREVAIEELGMCTGLSRAVMVLRPLLDSDDQRVRQLAYEGLRYQGDSTIRSFRIGRKHGFVLDIVPAGGRHLIAARHSKEPRITLFGRAVRCQTPVFYWHRNQTVMVNADAGDKSLKLVRRTPLSGRTSPTIRSNLDVASLITTLGRAPTKGLDGHYRGLGLTYSQVVEVLQDLCADKTIDATFVLQGDEAAEFTPPPGEYGRPESEL